MRGQQQEHTTDTAWHWQVAVRIDEAAHIWDATLTNSTPEMSASESQQELPHNAFEGFKLG